MAWAMSSGVVTRPLGLWFWAKSSSCMPAGIFSSAGVWVMPALIALAAMPRGASSTASWRRWAASAALAALTAPYWGITRMSPPEVIP